MKKVNSEKIILILNAVILIVCGILLACGGNAQLLNTMVGVSLLILGLSFLVISFTTKSNFNTILGLVGGALFGISIAMFCGFNIISTIFAILLYGGASIGFLLILNSIIRFVKKDSLIGIFELVLGAILATICMCTIYFDEIIIALIGIFRLLVICIPSLEKKLVKKSK